MRGSYGLVMVVFGLLVIAAHRLHPTFIPVSWLAAIHLVLAFGVAWVAVAVIVRTAQALRAPDVG